MMEMVFIIIVTIMFCGFTIWFMVKEIKEIINLHKYMKERGLINKKTPIWHSIKSKGDNNYEKKNYKQRI